MHNYNIYYNIGDVPIQTTAQWLRPCRVVTFSLKISVTTLPQLPRGVLTRVCPRSRAVRGWGRWGNCGKVVTFKNNIQRLVVYSPGYAWRVKKPIIKNIHFMIMNEFEYVGELYRLEVKCFGDLVDIILSEREDDEEIKERAREATEEEGAMFVTLPKEQAIKLAKQILQYYNER